MRKRFRRWWTTKVAGAIVEIRYYPDRGDESVGKILWAGVIVVIAGVAGGIFRDSIVEAFESLVIALGFSE